MREENLGPVVNPDGSPTELTKQMLACTGRDPNEFVGHDPEPTTNKQRAEWFGNAIKQLLECIDDPDSERAPNPPIKRIQISRDNAVYTSHSWCVSAYFENGHPFTYAMYISDDDGHMDMDGY